ncbi:P-loop containing nucleoside triphosphate hydrolase protein [Amylocystis lapponica]|nr:P-loop containing nucleoside triphosphate hydrolase protein [Amylocystis lapponica]
MTSLHFWKPGTTGPGSTLDRATETEGNVVQSAPISSLLSVQAARERLPIFKHREKLLYCMERYGVVIVVGQTGCGKTTQLPQYLHEAGWAADGNVIACTQPRRVAATSVAGRVATEVGSMIGDEVGYTIRFEDVSDKERTRILYMTDGMLFRETLVDPLLSRYSVIMIDEAHERSIYTDLMLGILKKIRRKRPSLRLIISSATLDATSFLDYFTAGNPPDEAIIVSLEGRMYPVQVAYLQEPVSDYVQKAAEVVWSIHLQAAKKSTVACKSYPNYCLRLTTDEQLRVFEPTERGSRKVIISTNIAEASVTIEGVKFVVDSGFVKIRTYNPTTALSSLATVPVSQASATQRAGRAGRTSSGICYRLYPESAMDKLPLTTQPEITRTDLTTPILQLKSLGIDDLMKFEWVTAPPAESVLRALEGLVAAGMVGEDGRLTVTGEKVAECPVEVNIARMLFSSKELKCGEEILTIAAMTAIQSQDVFVIPDGAPGALAELERRKFTAEEGDHLTLLNAYNAFTRYGRSSAWCKAHALSFRAMSRAVSIRSQLKKYMQRFGIPLESCEGDAKRLRRCLVSGYWRNGARWVADGTYRSVRGNATLHVHPNSVLFTRKPRSGWVVFHEMEETKKTQLLEHGHKYHDKRTGAQRTQLGVKRRGIRGEVNPGNYDFDFPIELTVKRCVLIRAPQKGGRRLINAEVDCATNGMCAGQSQSPFFVQHPLWWGVRREHPPLSLRDAKRGCNCAHITRQLPLDLPYHQHFLSGGNTSDTMGHGHQFSPRYSSVALGYQYFHPESSDMFPTIFINDREAAYAFINIIFSWQMGLLFEQPVHAQSVVAARSHGRQCIFLEHRRGRKPGTKLSKQPEQLSPLESNEASQSETEVKETTVQNHSERVQFMSNATQLEPLSVLRGKTPLGNDYVPSFIDNWTASEASCRNAKPVTTCHDRTSIFYAIYLVKATNTLPDSEEVPTPDSEEKVTNDPDPQPAKRTRRGKVT